MLDEICPRARVRTELRPAHTSAGNGKHVSESKYDLMHGPETWVPPQMLDVGRDDYFMAGIPGCPDLSDSPDSNPPTPSRSR